MSQRLPISTVENVLSNAERRALRNGETTVVPRIADIYAALPAITGKLELEYEGEIKGADAIARDVIRAAIARAYDHYFHGNNGHRNRSCSTSISAAKCRCWTRRGATEVLESMNNIQGLLEKIENVGVKAKEPEHVRAPRQNSFSKVSTLTSASDAREERKFTAGEKQSTKKEQLFREEEDFSAIADAGTSGFN